MAERLAAIPGTKMVNDVVLNQVLVRLPAGGDTNRAALAAIQRDGTCWQPGRLRRRWFRQWRQVLALVAGRESRGLDGEVEVAEFGGDVEHSQGG
jgi:hypothetical protein